MSHRNMIHLQRAVMLDDGLAQMDKEVAQLHEEGYHVERDRVLEHRYELESRRDELLNQDIA